MTPASQKNTPTRAACIAIFGDTHCGSSVGLMRPHRQYALGHGMVMASRAQEAIWQRFEEYAAIIREKRRKRVLCIVVAGDMIDGDHHGTLQLVTRDEDEQRKLFTDCIDFFKKQTGYDPAKGDSIYVCNGTEPTHGRKNTTNSIGEYLESVPFREASQHSESGAPLDGWYAHQRLRREINGVLLDIAHHPPVGRGSRTWANGNALRQYVRSLQMQLDARRQKLPAYWIRAHRHSPWHEPVRFDNGTASGILTDAFLLPCFQGKSDFPYRIGVDMPTGIGGLWIQVDEDGAHRCGLEYTEFTQPEDETHPL